MNLFKIRRQGNILLIYTRKFKAKREANLFDREWVAHHTELY